MKPDLKWQRHIARLGGQVCGLRKRRGSRKYYRQLRAKGVAKQRAAKLFVPVPPAE